MKIGHRVRVIDEHDRNYNRIGKIKNFNIPSYCYVEFENKDSYLSRFVKSLYKQSDLEVVENE